jgi:hypothetical protein
MSEGLVSLAGRSSSCSSSMRANSPITASYPSSPVHILESGLVQIPQSRWNHPPAVSQASLLGREDPFRGPPKSKVRTLVLPVSGELGGRVRSRFGATVAQRFRAMSYCPGPRTCTIELCGLSPSPAPRQKYWRGLLEHSSVRRGSYPQPLCRPRSLY